MGKKLPDELLGSLPSSWDEAVAVGSEYFFTGERCRNGHLAQRKTNGRRCFDCVSDERKRYRENNPQKIKAFNSSRRTPEYRAKLNAEKRDKYASNPNFRANTRLNNIKQNYGISLSEYDQFFEAQEGKCAICQSTERGDVKSDHLNVDHNHETGEVRGLLCSPCNKLLGDAKDDIKILELAVDYLERTQSIDFRDDAFVTKKLGELKR